jgi:putative tryptophan/tyrosine transport system substrate-binding protein
MRRRDFIALLGSTVAAWPMAARAQEKDRVRRIAVMLGFAFPEHDSAFAAFRDALAKLGWIEGRNLRIDVRASANEPNRIHAYAVELAGLAPDAIVTWNLLSTREMQQQTQSIPIIFTGVGGDPVAAGVVGNIAHPDGNATGFTNLFNPIAGKWVELLKSAAPHVTRIALLFNPAATPRLPMGYIGAAEEAAPALAVQLTRMPIRDDLELVRAIDTFGGEPNAGLVVLPPATTVNFGLLLSLAVNHQLPALFPDRAFVNGGGLISYGSIRADLFRGAASYVDRILRGAKVSELPVQYPTKFELVMNLKAAKAIGLTVPQTLVAAADEVIE